MVLRPKLQAQNGQTCKHEVAKLPLPMKTEAAAAAAATATATAEARTTANRVSTHNSPPTSSSKRPRAMTRPEMTSTMTTITERRPMPITGSGIGVAADALRGTPTSTAGATVPTAATGNTSVGRTVLGTNTGPVPKSTAAVKHTNTAETRGEELRAMAKLLEWAGGTKTQLCLL